MNRLRGRPKDSESAELRAKIIEAAADQFASAGYQGTRIEGVAKAAGCDRSLIYFYFKSKKGLFEATLNEAADYRTGQMAAQPQTLADGLMYWFRQNLAEPRRIRLIMQEGLADLPSDTPDRRSEYLDEQLNVVRHFQEMGLIRPDLDPRHLLTVFLALTSFPACFPQIARVTLDAATNARVDEEWSNCLRDLARLLAPE